jgi:hypothetical protein
MYSYRELLKMNHALQKRLDALNKRTAILSGMGAGLCEDQRKTEVKKTDPRFIPYMVYAHCRRLTI